METGTSYYKEDNFQEAASFHRQAIELGTSVLGAGHARLASPINNLALVSWKAGKNQEAIENFRRARAIIISQIGAASPGSAMIQVNIALVHIDEQDLVAADKELALAIPALEKALGAKHPMLAEAIAARATVFVEKQD